MKKLFFSIAFITGLLLLQAQSYQPFVLESAHWNMSEYINMGEDGSSYLKTDYCFKMEGDTSINQVVYKKLFDRYTQNYYSAGSSIPGTYSIPDWQWLGLMREDTLLKKVYFRKNCASCLPQQWCGADSLSDSLLFDFSIQNADSIAIHQTLGPANACLFDSVILDTIQTENIYNAERKEWIFQNNSLTHPARLIEGVGYSFGLFGVPFPDGATCCVDYYTELNNYCIGPDSVCGICYTKPVGIPDMSTDAEISIAPNPASDFIMLTASYEIKKVVVTDIQGHLVFIQNYDQTKITLPLSGLAKGMYICKIYLTQTAINKLVVVN